MNSKAFVFSLTALYFAMIFVLFLGIIVYNQPKPIYRSDVPVMDKVAVKYINGDDNVGITDINKSYWCVTKLVYDANAPDETQATSITTKLYCENYGIQRIV